MNPPRSDGVVASLLAIGCVAGSEIVIEPQDPELVETGAELYAARCARKR